MTIVDGSLLEDLLSRLDVGLGANARVTVAADGRLPVAAHTATLAYVVEGDLLLDADTLAVDLDVHEDAVTASAAGRRLRRGDAFLSLGRRPIALTSPGGAEIMTAEVTLHDPTGVLWNLPGFTFVSGFDRIEPAAAALAANIGIPSSPETTRGGDPVICRLMTMTVLLSLLRAWAHAGCAPEGWPATTDPFLQRVASAVHDDPGRDWSVDVLAAHGAMSRTVFTERFRAAFGRSPAGYVTTVRMERAKQLLAAGRTVSETSRELGYASDEGFSRAFRRHTGVVPSRWVLAAV